MKNKLIKTTISVPEEPIETKSFTFTETLYPSGSRWLHRNNVGFTALELLGISALIHKDITEQMNNPKKYNRIVRNAKLDGKDITITKKDE